MSGVTPQGFERPTFSEIQADLRERARELLGPVNTGPESAIGQQIAIQAEREAVIWEALEAVYLGQYPRSASGFSLDGAVQLTGVTRLSATRTTVQVDLTGDPTTVIPTGSEASTDNGDLFELVEDVTLDANGEGSGQIRAVEAGEVLALAGTVTNIETPVSGWDSVTNPDDGNTGRPQETDPELRQRQQESLAVTGAGTVEAIRSRLLQQVDDVTAATIIENRSDTTDGDGRPPHSFESVVSGGVDQEVADLIWEVKPAGIETHGDIDVTVTDSQGETHLISFSRPILVYLWARITIVPDGTGSYPGDAEAETSIKDAVVAYGDELGVGDDVIFQALYGPVYDNVPGIQSATIELAATSNPGDTPSYSEANITIGANEASVWLADRVEVVVP